MVYATESYALPGGFISFPFPTLASLKSAPRLELCLRDPYLAPILGVWSWALQAVPVGTSLTGRFPCI